MVILSIIVILWKSWYKDFYRIAQIITFSPLLFFSILAIPICLIEAVIFEGWMILLELCHRDHDVKGMLKFMLDVD